MAVCCLLTGFSSLTTRFDVACSGRWFDIDALLGRDALETKASGRTKTVREMAMTADGEVSNERT
jgi:hypothetical protein